MPILGSPNKPVSSVKQGKIATRLFLKIPLSIIMSIIEYPRRDLNIDMVVEKSIFLKLTQALAMFHLHAYDRSRQARIQGGRGGYGFFAPPPEDVLSLNKKKKKEKRGRGKGREYGIMERKMEGK